MNIEKKAKNTIKQQNLLRPGQRVIAAVSGGADSVALVLFLSVWCKKNGGVLYAAHVNHGLRPTADRDEAFVRKLCCRLGIPLFVCKAALGERGLFSEEQARQARYAFFDRLAQDYHAKVATAHTLDDQAETVLFRLVRGSSVAGAGGIPACRGVYIRPFLDCTRADTEALCQAAGVGFMTDETNLNCAFARNRIRWNVLPELSKVNSRAKENLAAFAQDAAQIASFLEREALQLVSAVSVQEGYTSLPTAGLLTAAVPVRRQALAMLAEKLCTPDRKMILRMEQALLQKVQKTELVRGIYAGVRREHFVLWRDMPPVTAQLPFGLFLEGGSTLYNRTFAPFGFRVRLVERHEMIKICEQNKKQLKNLADYAMIDPYPIFRTRRAGETFRPAGRKVTKTLKELLAEQGLAPPLRERLPLLAGEKTVEWVWGIGFRQGLAPNSNCRRAVYIETQWIGMEGEEDNA